MEVLEKMEFVCQLRIGFWIGRVVKMTWYLSKKFFKIYNNNVEKAILITGRGDP
jgi:hypothetical protein